MTLKKETSIVGFVRGVTRDLPIVINPRRGARMSRELSGLITAIGTLPALVAESVRNMPVVSKLAILSTVLVACAPRGLGVDQPTPMQHVGDGDPDGHPTVGPTAETLQHIELTPAPIPTTISPETLSLSDSQAMPPWVGGEMAHTGDPGGLQAIRADEHSVALTTLGLHGLVPVTDSAGVALSYLSEQGEQFFPLVSTVGDINTGAPMTAEGVADERGVVTFRSADGTVTEQFLASLTCPDGVTCVQAVSFNSDTPEREGDAGVLYYLQIDDKGKIVRHVASGVAADAVAAGEEIPWVAGASEVWQLDKSGDAAIAQIMRQGTILWDGDEYVFESGGVEFTALPHEVTLTTDFGGLVQSDEGVFVWDVASAEWVAASAVPAADGAEWGMWSAGGREFVIIDGEGHWVESSAVGDDGGVTLTLTTGERMKWGEQGWEAGLHQAEYWLNPDGTVKPGEVIPSGCLQVEGKDTCVFNPAGSPAIYEGLLKVIYNFTVSFGGNPGKFWDKSGDWSEREARLPGAADQFVQACREGQIFHDLTNMERWMGGERSAQTGASNALALVYARPFGTGIDCRNIGVSILTPAEMRAGWERDELTGFWSTEGNMWYAMFEAVPLDDGSGNSQIVFKIGRLEDKSNTLSKNKLVIGETSEGFLANLGLIRFIPGMTPDIGGSIPIRSPNYNHPERYVVLTEQPLDPLILQNRGEEKLQAYFDQDWGGGLVAAK